jgi:hypothetical protein
MGLASGVPDVRCLAPCLEVVSRLYLAWATGRCRVISVCVLVATLALSPACWSRTITVVYDDSGSMRINSRWSYASYSLQVLRGLLRGDNKLNVFYMNQEGAPGEYIGPQAQADIDAIAGRANYAGNNTPYGAVIRAMQSIEESAETDPWLLVITDGGFDAPLPDIDAQIRAFITRKPQVRVIFLGIAQSTNPVFDMWRDVVGAELFFAESVQGIFPTMVKIGSRMTALGSSSGASSISLNVAGNSGSFVPIFPLRRLVLMQQADAKESLLEVQAAGSGAQAMRVIPPVFAASRGSVRLAAAIHQIQPATGQSLPAGAPLQLTFAKNVGQGSQFTVFPEVDADFSVVYRDSDGAALRTEGNTAVACARKKVRIDAKVTFPAPHATSALPRDRIEVKSRAGSTSLAHRLVQDTFLEEVDLRVGEHSIVTTASFPGYFFFQKNGLIRVVECAPRQVSIAAGPAGQSHASVGSWSAPVTKLDEAPGFEVWPMIDGRRATPAEFEQMAMKFDLGKLHASVITHADRWEIKPQLRWNTAALTRVGDFPIPIELVTKRADDVINIPKALEVHIEDPGWLERFGPFVGKLLGMLLLAIYIWGILSKDRFRPSAKVEVRNSYGATRTIYPKGGLRGWIGRWVVPFSAERLERTDIPLLAGPNGRLRIPARAIQPDWRRDDNPDPVRPGRDLLLRTQDILVTGTDSARKTWKYISG